MKLIGTSIAVSALIATAAWAQPQPHYLITDLGPKGSPFAQAAGLNNSGVITGFAAAPDFTQHAVVWYKGQALDISKPGLGGPNTAAFSVNESGLVLVQAEGSAKDSNNENFCGYGTGLKCLPALWQNGVMTPLPLLGGNNGEVGSVNNRGEASGTAENATVDPDCPAGMAVSGLGPQVLDYKPVIWGPKPGAIRQLSLPPGDTVGFAFGINDNGQAAGMTGTCANTQLPGIAAAAHAVFWDSDGSVLDLGNLGGTSNPAVLGEGNAALAVNNRGEVVGTSSLHDNVNHHPFLWTRRTGMQDLGVLEGDNIGAGLAINSQGDIVGASVKGPDPITGNPRAALWRNGEKFDLNALALPGSPLYLLTAFGINDSGQIVGFGADKDGNLHGFLATPAQTKAAAGPKALTLTTSKSILLDGTQSTSADGNSLTYVWTIPQGSPSAAISGGTAASPTVTFSSIRGPYTFQLTVTDSTGATSTDSVSVQFMGE
jgi:probable HAF family extracellular repeat protein